MSASGKIVRRTVDLSGYPDLVVIYLGMKVTAPKGLGKIAGLGPQIAGAVRAAPDGLLRHENFLFSLWPPHAGMRQYWRDLDSLERWTRTLPHQAWWRDLLRDPEGVAFWHEAYGRRGFEAVPVVAQAASASGNTPSSSARGVMPDPGRARRCFRRAGTPRSRTAARCCTW